MPVNVEANGVRAGVFKSQATGSVNVQMQAQRSELAPGGYIEIPLAAFVSVASAVKGLLPSEVTS